MKNSSKRVKSLEEIIGSKVYLFPDELSNERFGPENKKCILLRINGISHYIPTGERIEITDQEFAILKDSSILTGTYTYEVGSLFDPFHED